MKRSRCGGWVFEDNSYDNFILEKSPNNLRMASYVQYTNILFSIYSDEIYNIL